MFYSFIYVILNQFQRTQEKKQNRVTVCFILRQKKTNFLKSHKQIVLFEFLLYALLVDGLIIGYTLTMYKDSKLSYIIKYKIYFNNVFVMNKIRWRVSILFFKNMVFNNTFIKLYALKKIIIKYKQSLLFIRTNKGYMTGLQAFNYNCGGLLLFKIN
jgi:hypothetical protein